MKVSFWGPPFPSLAASAGGLPICYNDSPLLRSAFCHLEQVVVGGTKGFKVMIFHMVNPEERIVNMEGGI